LIGTGVPFDLKKIRTDHPIRIKAPRKISEAKMIENGLGNIPVMPNNLSTFLAIRAKENITME
jgi:hypothetical protein